MRPAHGRIPLLIGALFLFGCEEPAGPTELLNGNVEPNYSHTSTQELCCHDQWLATGTFTDVVTSLPNATYTGLGTDLLTWGVGSAPSSAQLIEFQQTTLGTGACPSSGVLVSFGHFNGTIAIGTPIDGGEFTIDVLACNFFGETCIAQEPPVEVLRVPFTVISTLNTTDPIASADGLIFPDLPKNVWVMEGFTTRFEILYQQRSPIEIVDIRAISPGGFVSVGEEPEPVVQVDVALKPDGGESPVNPRARGAIPVAFFGSPSFDVGAIDVSTLRMGSDGNAAPQRVGQEDVNGDGIADLVAHFQTEETGIVCGDSIVIFSGLLTTGEHLSGVSEITTVRCQR